MHKYYENKSYNTDGMFLPFNQKTNKNDSKQPWPTFQAIYSFKTELIYT